MFTAGLRLIQAATVTQIVTNQSYHMQGKKQRAYNLVLCHSTVIFSKHAAGCYLTTDPFSVLQAEEG